MQDLVPEAPPLQIEKTTYVMQVAPSTSTSSAPSKKVVTTTEMWDIKNLTLCRLCNVRSIDSLPKIWRTLAPPKKEKTREKLEIAFQNKAREIIYKAPRIIHVVAGLILRLSFHT